MRKNRFSIERIVGIMKQAEAGGSGTVSKPYVLQALGLLTERKQVPQIADNTRNRMEAM